MEQMNLPEEMKVEINFDDTTLSESMRTFRPLIYQDGDAYCCLLGPDPQEGVFGCGKTPQEALSDWDTHLQDRIQHHSPNDEVAQYICDTLKASVNKVW